MSSEQSPAVAALIARAFDQVPAAEANAAIAWVREQAATGGVEAVSYEVVIPAKPDVDAVLTTQVLPRLVYFLDSRGARPPECSGVVVSMFVGDQLYFAHARDVVEVLGGLAGLSAEELVQKYGAASV